MLSIFGAMVTVFVLATVVVKSKYSIFQQTGMNHSFSVFATSCLSVPVDPVTKMPKTAYERNRKTKVEICSNDSSSIRSISPIHIEADKLKKFYSSIPNYDEIHHLPPEQFYSTLKQLREKKKLMLGEATTLIEDIHFCTESLSKTKFNSLPSVHVKEDKAEINKELRKQYLLARNNIKYVVDDNKMELPKTNIGSQWSKRETLSMSPLDEEMPKPDKVNTKKSKRIPSACSISWNDNVKSIDEVDSKFDKFFEGQHFSAPRVDEFQTRSLPTSPLRGKRFSSPLRFKSSTVPKPFKMTKRDEDEQIASGLRSLRKSLSDDLLHQKRARKRFRARPVPIESRIPLYDKILEDQAMRFCSWSDRHLHLRAISKINSEAELRAQMQPFSFTEREECALPGQCVRATTLAPQPKRRKRFRARPVPKHLFSNYVFDRRESDVFRSFNRRIRAEEMLRHASLPGAMAARDRSRLSTPAAHSDLPVDPSPPAPSATPTDRARSPCKDKRRGKGARHQFITTSPEPFRLSTAERAQKKMEDMKRIYTKSTTTESTSTRARVLSALELRAPSAGRSNLAALLRAEAARRRAEAEVTSQLEEYKRRIESRVRDRQLRSKPAWHLVRNNHEEDIAMRLQTRRDEERLRREEFLHEMELMYGRVRQQPMLFERYYAPRPCPVTDCIQLSPRKKRGGKRSSRKVSCDLGLNEDVAEYLNEKTCSDSEALDSLEGRK